MYLIRKGCYWVERKTTKHWAGDDPLKQHRKVAHFNRRVSGASISISLLYFNSILAVGKLVCNASCITTGSCSKVYSNNATSCSLPGTQHGWSNKNHQTTKPKSIFQMGKKGFSCCFSCCVYYKWKLTRGKSSTLPGLALVEGGNCLELETFSTPPFVPLSSSSPPPSSSSFMKEMRRALQHLSSLIP